MPFSIRLYLHFHGMTFVVCLLSLTSSMASADSLWSGAWVLREPPQGGRLIMTVEEVGIGWNLTYKVVGPDAPVSTVSTVLDAARRQGRSSIGQWQAIGPNNGDKKGR